MVYNFVCFSTSDWKYGAEQFVKQLPDKVIVHCKKIEESASLMYYLNLSFLTDLGN